jgi:2-polyprenyl-3-methyl-5-hydroxy-6-metoxy-1,4-benzoquinol methylase
MNKELQQRLLALNKAFYATVAEPFDATRLAPSAGKSELVRRLPLAVISQRTIRHSERSEESPSPSLQRGDSSSQTPRNDIIETRVSDNTPTLADIGCGNGRLAWLLDQRSVPLDYVGVDANAQLLALAQAHTAELRHVRAAFVQADLAQPDWSTLLPRPVQAFDIVTCLATLHHLPGYDLRRAVMQQFAEMVTPGGIVAISTWQFLTTPRFSAKLVDWAEVGIDAAQVEPGDALLPWNQGGYAVRYLHQIDLDEVTALAAAVGLSVEATYFADGKEGNLNLYTLLRRPPN